MAFSSDPPVLSYAPPKARPPLAAACALLWLGYMIGIGGSSLAGMILDNDYEGFPFLPLVMIFVGILSWVPAFLFGIALWRATKRRNRTLRANALFWIPILSTLMNATLNIIGETMDEDSFIKWAILSCLLFLPALLARLFTTSRPECVMGIAEMGEAKP